MTSHRLDYAGPVPSGWLIHCTCGWEDRGTTEDDAITRFLDHTQHPAEPGQP
jgi:hypothetical protein